MPNITASPAVDVALGLVFLFFLLSIICSAVNELIAAVLGWRSRFLEDGLRSMLSGDGDSPGTAALVHDLAQHPLIRGKVDTRKTGWLIGRLRRRLRPRRFPSYLNKKTFALTFLDTVAPPEAGSDKNVLARAEEFAKRIPDDSNAVRRVLLAFLDQAGNDVDRFRSSVETWFDFTMDRVSGWYKRRTQIALCVIAVVVTLLCNADALQIGRALWNDDAVRAAVVAEAQKAVDQGNTTPDVGKGPAAESPDTLSRQVADVRSLDLPLGWSTDRADPRWFDSVGGAIGKVLGLLATMLALTLGAPFWFDLLGRVSRLRTTGKPERPGAA